jgi:hypothetical protein
VPLPVRPYISLSPSPNVRRYNRALDLSWQSHNVERKSYDVRGNKARLESAVRIAIAKTPQPMLGVNLAVS